MATATELPKQDATRHRARAAMTGTILRGEGRAAALATSGDVLTPPRWRGSWRVGSLLLTIFMGVLAVAVLALIVLSGLAMAFDGISFLELGRCDSRSFSCGIVGGLLVTLIPLAVAYAVLVMWRVRRVRRRYVKQAKKAPAELVEGAATVTKVVGRDDLCGVIMRDLRSRKRRRPHVLVGGVGVGKTAVLVQLTKLLVESGAVPVPIRLREYEQGLNFREQARDSFRRFAERTESANNADEVWRKLCDRDKIVIIADGLEEAMHGVAGRHSAIRLAINDVKSHGLPLVVASRPHDALSSIDAAILPLEPLAEASACEFIKEGGPPTDDVADDRVERIVERAEVVEAPLYMQMAHELQRLGVLDRVDTRGASRLVLRKRLIEQWTEALIGRRVRPHVPLVSSERRRAIDLLGRLACIGLRNDRLEVTFAEAAEDLKDVTASEVRFAATAGAQLGLVEARPEALRFRHSIMQAYLGARGIPRLMSDRKYVETPLGEPGREILMALAMACAGEDGRGAADGLRARLLTAAQRTDEKSIELLGAAVEIDTAVKRGTSAATAEAIRTRWVEVTSQDEATLEAKLRIVARIGEGRGDGTVGARRRFRPRANSSRNNACEALWHIAMHDRTYRVRHHAALELGAAGDEAFATLAQPLHDTLDQAVDVYRRSATVDAEQLRRFTLSGWLLPLFVGSVRRTAAADDAANMLNGWLELVDEDMHRAVEASFAQGFKYAANRRRGNPDTRRALVAQATAMRRRATFWFSRIALIQALTLWELTDGIEPTTTAEAQVRQWLRPNEHEFVRQTAGLCASALKEGRPSRYVWIDETGVTAKVGPSARRRDWAQTRRQWISPAVGWFALHPVARQLVGDIVVLLNLAERGVPGKIEDIGPRDARLRATEKELPHCITHHGARLRLGVLEPELAADNATPPKCAIGCDVDLCPLPARGEPAFRGELRETFCRNQARLVGERGPAPWQHQSRKELQKFWTEMERRAQQS